MGGLVLAELRVGGLGARKVKSAPQFNRMFDFVGTPSRVATRRAHGEGVLGFY